MRLLDVTLQRITESYQIIEDDVHSRWKNLYLGMSELGSLESLVVKYASFSRKKCYLFCPQRMV